MKETKIELRWKKNKEEHKKMIDRKEFFAIFDELAKAYAPYDNVISKKLVEIIPTVDRIEINEDFNGSQDEPMILYIIGSQKKILKIKRCHKIVWGKLQSYYE